MTHKPTVLLTGGTSQVGIFAIPRLLDAGYRVVALSRKIKDRRAGDHVKKAGCLRWIGPADFEDLGSLQAPDGAPCLAADIDVLISCGPVSLAAEKISSLPGLKRVVCVSTSSVYSKMESADSGERQLIAAIRASEDALLRHCESRNIALALLRPTLIYGCGLDNNVSRIAYLAKRFGFIPVAGKASGLRQPVHADDLALLIVNVLRSEALTKVELPVGGGSVLSYRELVERIFQGLGLRSRILPVNPAFLAFLAGLFSWLPVLQGVNRQFVFRQNVDLVFEDHWVRHHLAFDPRPFFPGKNDFEVPLYARSLQPP